MSKTATVPAIGEGIYTLPDAGRILHIPATKMRRWISGYLRDAERVLPLGEMGAWGKGKERGFNFFTLIELFSVIQFREHGVSLKTLRNAREELSERLRCKHPFAHKGLVSNGNKLLFELREGAPSAFLELGSQGQTAFKHIMDPFCKRLDFHTSTHLAERYWPDGKRSSVVVDPRNSFGRPSIVGTNITTESLDHLIMAGETIEDVAEMFDLEPRYVADAQRFEHQLKAA